MRQKMIILILSALLIVIFIISFFAFNNRTSNEIARLLVTALVTNIAVLVGILSIQKDQVVNVTIPISCQYDSKSYKPIDLMEFESKLKLNTTQTSLRFPVCYLYYYKLVNSGWTPLEPENPILESNTVYFTLLNRSIIDDYISLSFSNWNTLSYNNKNIILKRDEIDNHFSDLANYDKIEKNINAFHLPKNTKIKIIRKGTMSTEITFHNNFAELIIIISKVSCEQGLEQKVCYLKHIDPFKSLDLFITSKYNLEIKGKILGKYAFHPNKKYYLNWIERSIDYFKNEYDSNNFFELEKEYELIKGISKLNN